MASINQRHLDDINRLPHESSADENEQRNSTSHQTEGIKRSVTNNRPREPSQDYLTMLETKRSLVEDIYQVFHSCMESIDYTKTPKASLWCILYQQNTHQLRDIRTELRERLRSNDRSGIIRYIDNDFFKASEFFIKALCIFHRGHDRTQKIGQDEVKKRRRNPQVVQEALNRDGAKCILLGTASPQVCHIIPFAILHDTQMELFLLYLDFMRLTFPAELVARVTEKMTVDNIIDTTQNVVCMNAQMHKYWADGRFSLEPWGDPHQEDCQVDEPSDDQQSSGAEEPRSSKRRRTDAGGLWCQEVRFLWMRQTNVDMQVAWDGRGKNPRDLIPPRPGEYDHWSIKTGRVIDDGEIIVIKAKLRADLPDRDFLYVQHKFISGWSMAAGAEPKHFRFFDAFDAGPDDSWIAPVRREWSPLSRRDESIETGDEELSDD